MAEETLDGSWDDLEVINDLIDQRIKFLRHYDGQVILNIDPEGEGKVLVEIPELGIDILSQAWASPRQTNGLILPDIGEYVECYFINGDPDRLVYIGSVHELENTVSHTGDPTVAVLFESNLLQNTIEHDDKVGKFSIDSLLFDLGQATDPMVKGGVLLTFLTTLVTELNAFVTAYNSHAHPTAGTGPPSPPTVPATSATPPTAAINSLKNRLD